MIEVQIAGAGAGKTHGLAQKIILHYDPTLHKKIFAITYTNNAAKNISETIIKQLGYLPENIVVCTVHTFLLNEIIYPYSPFVLNEVHTTSSRCKTFSNFPPGKTEEQKKRENAFTISRLKKSGVIHVDETYSAAWRVVDENYSKHSSHKKKSKVRKVHKLLSSAIDKIFLDEAQDLDEIALKAFQQIGENSVDIYMVGDPKQAIDYPKSFKGWLAANKANEKVKVLPNITTSRRVPQRILDLSNTFCPSGQEQTSLSEVEGRLRYITSEDDHYDEILRHHIENGSLVSIFRKEGNYSTKQAGSLPEFDPEIEKLLTKKFPEYEEGVVIYSLQRFFASLLSINDNNRSIRKFLAELEIPYEKELFKKFCRSAEQYSSSKDNSAKYAISSIQRTKGLESKVCVLVLTPAIFKCLIQDGVAKYNKTWNTVYVALTRAESELVVAVDMNLLGKEYKHDDIVESLESIGFEVLNPNLPNHKTEEKLEET
ncbi:UvrD-helicase domain-containing protein [Pectobacterium aroidearum]|uniref:UvrD-helicase domain-containing protein n=1 Tax=Pectobacterium aroidearum TaxID=1201031 RepID=UPI0015F029B6|nr:UvrD-helicase domain-containing protein [Pectobacterium aroidearum]MBA5239165.1 UvrD-helicase domain-containing protein [Pectobacterium aroidearum]